MWNKIGVRDLFINNVIFPYVLSLEMVPAHIHVRIWQEAAVSKIIEKRKIEIR